MTRHLERHRMQHIGWLRAAVLGANDGIVSTASLVVGVAAAEAGKGNVMVAGVAGLVAGAMSMAAGEYVSVSSQADTERADLERERHELATDVEFEHAELAQIYVHRGLDESLARQLSGELQVTAETPPTFLFQTDEDEPVPAENAVAFYLALRKAGVPAELHIYEKGRHGVGLARDIPATSSWPDRCREWMAGRGLLGDR